MITIWLGVIIIIFAFAYGFIYAKMIFIWKNVMIKQNKKFGDDMCKIKTTKMEAKYKIQTEDKVIEFKAKALNFDKCLQIIRISNYGKKWKGYSLECITFMTTGLSFLHIKSNKKAKTCPNCNRQFTETDVPSGIFCCIACEMGY